MPPLAPLAEDGFGQRLALDSDGLVVRVVIIGVEGGIRQADDEAARHHLPVDFVDRQRLLRGLRSGLGAFGLLTGRLGLGLRRCGHLLVKLLAELARLLWRERFDGVQEVVEVGSGHGTLRIISWLS